MGVSAFEVREQLVEEFGQQLAQFPDALVEALDIDDASRAANQAAVAALSSAVWTRVLPADQRWTTAEVAENLGVTRQALAKRIAAGTLVGLPARGTTVYPIWQFDLQTRPIRVRPVIAESLAGWVEQTERLDPYAFISWARTPQPELAGRSPLEMLEEGPQRVVFSARVTGSRRAQ